MSYVDDRTSEGSCPMDLSDIEDDQDQPTTSTCFETYVATSTYSSVVEDVLSFEKGDVIHILEKGDFWWRGRVKDKEGQLPKIFVQSCSQSDTTEAASTSVPSTKLHSKKEHEKAKNNTKKKKKQTHKDTQDTSSTKAQSIEGKARKEKKKLRKRQLKGKKLLPLKSTRKSQTSLEDKSRAQMKVEHKHLLQQYHLSIVVSFGNTEAALKLIDSGVSVTCPCYVIIGKNIKHLQVVPYYKQVTRIAFKWDLVMLATAKNHPECLEMLLKRGSGVNYSDTQGRTPLTLCVTSRYVRCARVLINYGARISPTEKDVKFWKKVKKLIIAEKNYVIPDLHFLLMKDHICFELDLENVEREKLLVKDINGNTLLHLVVMKRCLHCFQSLIHRDLNLDMLNNDDTHVLHIAAKHSDPYFVKELLKAGCNTRFMDKLGNMATHYAALYGNVKSLRHLLDTGIPVNVKNVQGLTPLHLALTSRNEECVSLLIVRGADVLIQTPNITTPLGIAAMEGIEFLRLLLPLNEQIVKSNAFPALHIAAMFNVDCLKELLNKSPIDEKDNALGASALHLAVAYDVIENVKLLLQHGADINGLDKIRNTPLSISVFYGFEECLNFLLQQKKLLINLRCGLRRFTALHVAVSKGRLNCMKILVRNHCEVNNVDKNGKSPLDYCVRYDRGKCYAYLLHKGGKHAKIKSFSDIE